MTTARRVGFDYLAASRHPFEIYLLVAALASGMPLLFGVTNNRVVDETYAPWLEPVWGAFLILGSATALVGTYWRGSIITGLVLERAGLVGVGGAAMIYAVALGYAYGVRGAYGVGITFGFGLACIAQSRAISRRLARFLARLARDNFYREHDGGSGSGSGNDAG